MTNEDQITSLKENYIVINQVIKLLFLTLKTGTPKKQSECLHGIFDMIPDSKKMKKILNKIYED